MPLKQPSTDHRKANRAVNDMEVLKETDLNFLGPKKAGKVRDIYDRGEMLILITTDRHSSFDLSLPKMSSGNHSALYPVQIPCSCVQISLFPRKNSLFR